MTTFGRYFNLLKRSGFGFNLPKGSLINYARIRLGILGDASKIGGGGAAPYILR
ncbi:hypothetical protein AGMMS50229_01080 [Campylobacterota bacterium]|nr:hypothetical protein AGMMS50229_01080 [Campylobacterota bacterium]